MRREPRGRKPAASWSTAMKANSPGGRGGGGVRGGGGGFEEEGGLEEGSKGGGGSLSLLLPVSLKSNSVLI